MSERSPVLEYTELERAAIEQMLMLSIEGIDIVREQFMASAVVKRDYTGVGFYTTISVPPSLAPIPDDETLRTQLSSGARVRSDPEQMISFQLWIRAGYLSCLEGLATKGDSWPDEHEMEVIPVKFRRVDDHQE